MWEEIGLPRRNPQDHREKVIQIEPGLFDLCSCYTTVPPKKRIKRFQAPLQNLEEKNVSWLSSATLREGVVDYLMKAMSFGGDIRPKSYLLSWDEIIDAIAVFWSEWELSPEFFYV